MPTKKTAVKKRAAPRRDPPPAAAQAPTPSTPSADASAPVLVCPRCGTAKFGQEERTRVDGRRTVRYTILVCERGHTFAKPVPR